MLKVLLVDDEPFILKGLAALIDWEKEGYEIAGTCSNGEEALRYLREHKADLILADIKMPVMSGIGLLQKIREENISDAFFVFLSHTPKLYGLHFKAGTERTAYRAFRQGIRFCPGCPKREKEKGCAKYYVLF